MTCLNCENEFKGQFCNECGQKATVQKITLSGVFSDIFKLLTNTDKGLFYNFINLTRKPKKIITGYLSGQRKGVFPPLQYVLLGVTILTLVDHYYGTGIKNLMDDAAVVEQMSEGSPYKVGMNFGKILKGNLKYALLLNIFFFAIPSRLFDKQYNLAEHIAIQAFILGHAAFVTICLYPLVNLTILVNPVFYGMIVILNFFVFVRRKEIFVSLLSAFFIVFLGVALFLFIPMIFYMLFAFN